MWYSAASRHSSWGLSHESGMKGDEAMQDTRRSALETLWLPSGVVTAKGSLWSLSAYILSFKLSFYKQTILPIQSEDASVLLVQGSYAVGKPLSRQTSPFLNSVKRSQRHAKRTTKMHTEKITGLCALVAFEELPSSYWPASKSR